ncbi:MAG TPA: DEAD/DEAH box helicase, partial [Myxococcota bacterium]|nr:DEAD/DEAH box helicase [Myxococcota bacterium]
YQARGYAWLACLGDLGLGACLADDMGLGKTLQVIAHLVDRKTTQRPGDPPSLVVCPTSLLGNWVREIARFAPGLTVVRHHGGQRDLARARQHDVVLTTYGLLARDQDDLAGAPWDVVVLDEAQAIKNPEAQRARSAFELRARHRIALTGTPVENRLEELWSIFHYLVPGLLGTRGHFRRHVAVPIERFGDDEAAQRLRLGTSPFLLRRLKTDPNVAPDLPDKVERHAWCALSSEQAALYRAVVEEHMERVRDAASAERRGQVLAMLTALKQVCNHPAHYLKDGQADERRSGKLQRAGELLDQAMERGERVLVFTQYREMGLLLQRWLGDWLRDRHQVQVQIPFLHGGVAAHDRDAMVEAFQEHPDAAPVLLVSLRAGGVGLNLTRATTVVHYDRWWNPAVEDQATDRAYRIGQQRNVQVFKLVVQGTLEERIDAMLRDKRLLADAAVATGEHLVTELDDDALRALVALGDDAVLEDE